MKSLSHAQKCTWIDSRHQKPRDGRELPGLPVSARAALRESHGTGRMGTVHGRVVGRRRLAMSYVLSGEQTVELTVKGR